MAVASDVKVDNKRSVNRVGAEFWGFEYAAVDGNRAATTANGNQWVSQHEGVLKLGQRPTCDKNPVR